MLRWLAVLTHLIRAFFRSQSGLAIENAALRQQLAVFKEKRPRPTLSGADRAFWVLLRRVWSGWSNALIVVKPETVVRWHRAGFKRYWRWKSRKVGAGARRPTSAHSSGAWSGKTLGARRGSMQSS